MGHGGEDSGGIAENPYYSRLLSEGLQEIAFRRDEVRERLLLRYLDTMLRWNKVYNLTAITDPVQMIYRHLIDSLAIAQFLSGKRFIDIGSGAGLPGIPLAICQTDRQFILLDSNGKKTRFLLQVSADLGLSNVEVVHNRVETYRAEKGFDGILCRAFSSLSDYLDLSSHLLAEDGVFYAMKGRLSEQELSDIPKDYSLRAIRPLKIPGGSEQRHLIELTSKN